MKIRMAGMRSLLRGCSLLGAAGRSMAAFAAAACALALAVHASAQPPGEPLTILGSRYFVTVADSERGQVVHPRYLGLVDVPPQRQASALSADNVGRNLELSTDRLTIRSSSGAELEWCEAEPIIASTLASLAGGIDHPYPMGSANIRPHDTPDGHTILVPRFGTVNAIFEILFVDESQFDYQERLETYINVFVRLFSNAELQALVESRIRRNPGTSLWLAGNLADRLGEFADLQEKIGAEALRRGSDGAATHVAQARRLGAVATTMGFVTTAAESFADAEQQRRFLDRALLIPMAEARMVAVLEYVESLRNADPALANAARIAYGIVKGGQRQLIDSFRQAAGDVFRSGVEQAILQFINAATKGAINAGLRSSGVQQALRANAVALSSGVGGSVAGLIQVGKDAWDFNNKVSHFVLLWNAAHTLHGVLQDAHAFPQHHDLSAEAFRQGPAIGNTLRLELHRWVHHMMIDDVGLSKAIWRAQPSWRALRDYLNRELPQLEYWELTRAELFGRLPEALGKVRTIYSPPSSVRDCSAMP